MEFLGRAGAPEKIETPQKIARKVDFSEPQPFTMHPVCTLLSVSLEGPMAFKGFRGPMIFPGMLQQQAVECGVHIIADGQCPQGAVSARALVEFLSCIVCIRCDPTVPEGHKHRVSTPGKPQKILRTPAEPPQRPRRTLRETPAEPSERPTQSPSERQISSESLAEGCGPRMVTLRNFRM